MIALEHPEAEKIARIIWSATMAAWGLCIGGDSYPNKQARFERMRKPQPGDMVAEASGGIRQFDCAAAVGWLIQETREPVQFDEWNEAEDGPIPTERVVYIRTIDGRDYRWTNCDFFQVPTHEGWWDVPRWQEKAAIARGLTLLSVTPE